MPRENGSDDAEAVVEVAKHQGLAPLSGFPFEVFTSASTREQAGRLADRCAKAYLYLGDLLAFRPRCALVVLNRADWSERASNPLYGMPYYSAGNLFLAGEPSDLTARLEEVASSAPPGAAQILDQVYGSGADRLVPFADLLIVHELAHAFHDGVPFVFPRSWLMELFADMALYAFVVAEEPGRRLPLETLPRVALENHLLKPVARDLRYFEAFYPYIEPLTYVWYQFRFTMMAKDLVDAAGPSVLRRLWDAFALTDDQLAGVLGSRVHPAAGQWLASWREPR
ncbi:MAG TPA: hypothetical protein VME19_00135 [Streptosporangiaceae bacterium]|nr:hypothetical protein [Streptosporangiaceae bacterium]